MFTIYHSNQMDIFKTIIAELITSNPLSDPFQPEIMLVQSNGMAQWMQVELAKQIDIIANIDFLLPASFIWKMFTSILPNIPEENAFTKFNLIWRLMALLPHLYQQSDFLLIKKYLNSDINGRKIFQFSTQVADLFDQYLVYRPNWLESWERGELIDGLGKDQRWQSKLWRALITQIEKIGQPIWHRANFYQAFIDALTHDYIDPSRLPNRVFICGITTFPSSYLQALQALANHIDIHLLFFNPSRYYWGDICDRIFLSRLLHRRRFSYQQKTEKELFQNSQQVFALFNELGEQYTSNPLLSSWGKQGRDNLYLLTQIDNVAEVDAFVEPTGNNLLSILQRDILNLEDHSVIDINNKMFKQNINKRELQLDDRSIRIHICHSAQREVEILQNNLLAMIMEDPTLQPRDIIVMVTDIDLYAPIIQAVFNNNDSNQYLPFTISNRRARYAHPILLTFIKLLDLPYSRFTSEEVLSLLELPELANHFSINEKELKILRLWIAESGIYWGLDEKTLTALKLPITCQHTWKSGLTRMLLGYAMNSENEDWEGVFPYDEPSGLMANLIGQLAEFIMKLRKWRDKLSQPHLLIDWVSYAQEIIDDFFTSNNEIEDILVLLKNQWQEILKYGLKAEYKQPVAITLIKDELISRLNNKRISQNFLAGTINFCTLMPMRSIPFKIICLLGMNHNVYPRKLVSISFDLMTQQRQRGDRNRRDDDRYLFLEALLSAQQKLYISFIGRSIQDNSLCYPSVLVTELIDYITQSFYLSGNNTTNTEINAERIRAHLLLWHCRTPFSPENFIPGKEIQSFSDKWLQVAIGNSKPNPNFISTLTKTSNESIALDELLRFYRHPVRTWFVYRLAVSFDQKNHKLATDEPFVVDGLTKYRLNKKLLNTLIKGECTNRLFHQLSASGLLPYGEFGKLYWIKQHQDITALFKRIQKWQLSKTDYLEVDLTINNIRLLGQLSNVQTNGLLRWCPKKLSIQDGLLLWLEHLIFCIIGGKGESRIYGIDGEWIFRVFAIDQAKKFLSFLISGYCKGMMSPLLLLPRAGHAWLNHCYDPISNSINYDKNIQCQAYKKIIQTWQGNSKISGEKHDPYLQRLINQLEDKHIKEIISATELYFLPLLKFNLANNNLVKYKKNYN